MLDRAVGRQPSESRVVWRQADALALRFADGSFDAVACQFGVMFFPDKARGFREARRVLRQGGRFLFNVWDRIEYNEFAACVTDALAALFPDDPPRFLARTPHGYHEPERVRADLTAAGFTRVSIQGVEHRSRAPSAREVAVAFCQGTPLRSEVEGRDRSRLDEATERAAQAVAAIVGTDAVDGRIRALVVTAEG